MSVAKQLMDPIVFLFPYYGSQWGPFNCLFTHNLQNILLCVQQQKEIHRFGTTWGRVIFRWKVNDESYSSGWVVLRETDPWSS